MAPTVVAKDHHLVLNGSGDAAAGQACVAYTNHNDNEVQLVSCGANKEVCLRDGKTGAVLASTANEGALKNGACNVLACHPTGFVAVGGEHAVKASAHSAVQSPIWYHLSVTGGDCPGQTGLSPETSELSTLQDAAPKHHITSIFCDGTHCLGEEA